MRYDLLRTAIITRAQADTGSGGLFETGAQLVNAIGYAVESRIAAGFNAKMPYISFSFLQSEQADGYDYDLCAILVQFHVWNTMARDADSDICHTILERLSGNATTQADREPDYGFHRWTGDLYLGLPPPDPIWKLSKMHLVTPNVESHEDGVWHFIQTYRVHASRVKP